MVINKLTSITKLETLKIGEREIEVFRLCAGEAIVHLTNYGGTIMSIEFPNRDGQLENVIAGFRHINDYLAPHPYLGSLVGRYANRISNGSVTIDQKSYQLSLNDGVNHLHGGMGGFHTKIWTVEKYKNDYDQCWIELSLTSPDGEEGYPGSLTVVARFTLTRFNELRLLLRGKTTKPTPVNLTAHPYFNLSGFKDQTIYGHYLKVNSVFFTEKGPNGIPTGKLSPCIGSELDFMTSRLLGDQIHRLQIDQGYDHNFAIDGEGLKESATLYHQRSGRRLTIYTDQPGLQVYTANWWDGIPGAHDKPYSKHAAVALETQNFPDAPNHKSFPNAILYPWQEYKTQTIYKFSID